MALKADVYPSMSSSDFSAHAEALADQVTQRIPPAKYTRTSRLKEGLILKLSEAGKTQVEIAAIVGVNQSTVSRVLAEFEDTRIHAKHYLHTHALSLAERIVKDADVDQSLEVLDRLDVAPKRQREADSNARVQVIVAMPGQTQLSPPTIDLSLVPRKDLGPASTG